MNSTTILRPAAVTAGLLLLPYLAMKFNWAVPDPGEGTDGVNWSTSDFVVMGTMLFITGVLLELVLGTKGKYRVAAAIAIVLGFLWLWAELAVGVFTTWGS